MTNKRRRRTIITITTTLLVLVFQLPNLLNMTVFRSQRNQRRAEEAAARSEMDTKRAQGQITTRQYADQLAEMKKTRAERRRSERHQRYVKISDAAVVTNALLPVGWLAFGARAAAQGSVWPGLLGSLAAFGLGALSLRRSYRTTLRTYLGGFTSRPRATKQVPAETTPGAGKNFLERELPWISGQPAAIALGGFRSLTRAPEGKMLLLTPLILLAIFGAMIFAGRDRAVAEQFRPLLGLGALSVTMLCFVQLLCNMFGFDRDGFRAYVLAPCRRRDLLLGKNLAIAPLTIGTCAVAIVAIQLFQPLHVTHLLATCVQAFTAYLLFCLAGNAVSILAPTAVSSGSLKPVEAKITTVIIHLVTVLVSPLVLLPALAAYGLELLLASIGWQVHLPIYLVLSLAELLAIAWLYRRVLDVEGRWLQAREQRILEIVSARVE